MKIRMVFAMSKNAILSQCSKYTLSSMSTFSNFGRNPSTRLHIKSVKHHYEHIRMPNKI